MFLSPDHGYTYTNTSIYNICNFIYRPYKIFLYMHTYTYIHVRLNEFLYFKQTLFYCQMILRAYMNAYIILTQLLWKKYVFVQCIIQVSLLLYFILLTFCRRANSIRRGVGGEGYLRIWNICSKQYIIIYS